MHSEILLKETHPSKNKHTFTSIEISLCHFSVMGWCEKLHWTPILYHLSLLWHSSTGRWKKWHMTASKMVPRLSGQPVSKLDCHCEKHSCFDACPGSLSLPPCATASSPALFWQYSFTIWERNFVLPERLSLSLAKHMPFPLPVSKQHVPHLPHISVQNLALFLWVWPMKIESELPFKNPSEFLFCSCF